MCRHDGSTAAWWCSRGDGCFGMFSVLAVIATIFSFGRYLFLLPLDLTAAVAWAMFTRPILSSGVVAHNMLEYYLAVINSVQQDWEPGDMARSS